MAKTWYISPNTYVTNGYVGFANGLSDFIYGSTASDGSVRVTVVDGTTYTGLYAADGSINVIPVDGSEFTGMQDGCGAMNVFSASADWTFGVIHACGALVVSESPYQKGTIPITIVGALSGSLEAPILDWDDETDDLLPDFTITYDAVINDVVTLRRSDTSDFTCYEDVIQTVTSIDPPTVLEFDFEDPAWAEQTWYVKAFYTRGITVSPHSDTETLTLAG